jgi:ABC-type amino acid transport substrate-binding protein
LIPSRFIPILFVFLCFSDLSVAENIIRVGISEGVSGLVDHSEGHLSGSLSSLYTCVFETSGLEPQYVSIPLKRGLYYLERGHLDALLPLARTPDRDESLVFAGELIRAEYAYVSFKPLPEVSGNTSLRFGIVRGFVGHLFIPESASLIEEVTSWSQLVPMLERGRVDASVIPSILVDDVLGERAKEAVIQKAGELSASMYISPRHELTNVSFRIMQAVEACRSENGMLSSR